MSAVHRCSCSCSCSRCPTAGILTLGCKVNQYESEAIAEALTARGFEIRNVQSPCDVYIINTCTVTSESDRKVRQAIRRLIATGPEAYVIVTGCSAQSHGEALAAIPGVDWVIGNRNKMHTVEAACQLIETGHKLHPPLVSTPSLAGSQFESMTITRFDRTRAYVKIQDGCQSHCTYCAIPQARGPIRSRSLEDTLREVSLLAQNGCREIVLTGIETGAWGYDMERDPDSGRRPNLCDLLGAVDHHLHSELNVDCRIRLGSLDPSIMTQPFVDSIARLACLAPHFHLSVQSGCSATLARMKRKYNADQAMAAMERLRAAIPGVQFTADMIAGFPGETEADFEESLDFARRAKFLHIHAFPYSRRDNTVAAAMPHQIPEQIKHRRAKQIAAVSAQSCADILDEMLAAGTPLDVLCEQCEDGFALGHTPHFVEVKIPTPCDLRGHEIVVRPVSREGEMLVCNRI